MGPGLYQPPTSSQMAFAILSFTVLVTGLAMAVWTWIRWVKQRPGRPVMWLVTAVLAASISSLDVSMATVSQGGSSGFFSIFHWIVIPVYAAIVVIVVAIAAMLVR